MPTCVTCYSKYEKSEYNQSNECDNCYSIPDPLEELEKKIVVESFIEEKLQYREDYF